MKPKVAIAGFAYGSEQYLNQARLIKSTNWDIYAHKHGYDTYLFEGALDPSFHQKNIMMQKLLIFDKLQHYDTVIYIDTDVIINPNSPPFPLHSIPSQSGLLSLPHKPVEGVADYAKKFGFKYVGSDIPQGGVLCLSSRKDFKTMRKLYFGKPIKQSHPVHAADQILLGMYFSLRGISYSLDERWNYILPTEYLPFAHRVLPYKFPFLRSSIMSGLLSLPKYKNRLSLALTNNYFIHMAGGLKQYIPHILSLYQNH